MRPRDRDLARRLEDRLISFDREKRPLLGIRDPIKRGVLLEQLLESIHRVKYVSVIRERKPDACRADPKDDRFDPLKAAIFYQRQGHTDEAFWLVFLFVHFGKHPRGGWRYAREVYGGLGANIQWDWARISTNPSGFREWLNTHQNDLKREGVPGGFGNHRKYLSLDAYSLTGTGASFESYVRWVNPPRTHPELIAHALEQSNSDPRKAFDILYQSMNAVASFGRTARFDYLSMIGNLGLAPIEPGSTYMQGATGPLSGARLLFAGRRNAALKSADLDKWLVELEDQLKIGMQVLEDSLCNWQKNPEEFKRFRG